MAIHSYPTRYGVVKHSDVCKDDWGNMRTVERYPAKRRKGAPPGKERAYLLRLQEPAMRSYLAAERHLGFELKLTGSWRSCAYQRDLWESDQNRYAHPNSTLHTQGLAIDVHTGILNAKVKKALLDRGWKQSRPDDEPWHFSFKLKA